MKSPKQSLKNSRNVLRISHLGGTLKIIILILDTDYSLTNLAAVLSQKQSGKEVLLGCVARKCNKAKQKNYPSHKGELCALALGLHKFEHKLRARTDSQCLKYLSTMKEYRGIYARIQT